MTSRTRARKHAQRLAHQQRRDNRQPDARLTADERRVARRDLRREQRPEKPAREPRPVRVRQPMPEMTSAEKRARRLAKRSRQHQARAR